MSQQFETVKNYVLSLNLDISSENKDEEILVVQDESRGIKDLIMDCEDSVLVIEQFILNLKKDKEDVYKRLLQMNRTFIHGAFVLDEGGSKVIFRDTLQLKNLDLNELEATINSLSLALAENATELIAFSK